MSGGDAPLGTGEVADDPSARGECRLEACSAKGRACAGQKTVSSEASEEKDSKKESCYKEASNETSAPKIPKEVNDESSQTQKVKSEAQSKMQAKKNRVLLGFFSINARVYYLAAAKAFTRAFKPLL